MNIVEIILDRLSESLFFQVTSVCVKLTMKTNHHCACGVCVLESMQQCLVEVTGQLTEISFLIPPYEIRESNSCVQIWWQRSLSTNIFLVFNLSIVICKYFLVDINLFHDVDQTCANYCGPSHLMQKELKEKYF